MGGNEVLCWNKISRIENKHKKYKQVKASVLVNMLTCKEMSKTQSMKALFPFPNTLPCIFLPYGCSWVISLFNLNKLLNICLFWTTTLLYSQNNPSQWSIHTGIVSYSSFLLQPQSPLLCGLLNQSLLMDICPVSTLLLLQ